MKSPTEYAETTNSEFAHQVALFMWAAMVANHGIAAANDAPSYTVAGHAAAFGTWRNDRIPELKLLHAIKNQGHGDTIRGAKSRAEGVKAGVFDTFWPVAAGQYHGLYLEMKKPKGGVVSAEQLNFKAAVERQAYKAIVCRSFEEAKAAILNYWNSGI